MIEVEMNKDIREIEPKVIASFTGRQLTFVAIGLGVGLVVGLIIPLSTIGKITAGVICGVPFAMCGWVKMFGLTLDKFILQILKTMTDSPKRKYESRTTFDYLEVKDAEIKKVKRSKKYKGYK